MGNKKEQPTLNGKQSTHMYFVGERPSCNSLKYFGPGILEHRSIETLKNKQNSRTKV